MQDAQLKDFMKSFHISDSQLHQLYRNFASDIAKGLAKSTHAQADSKCFVTYVQQLPTGLEVGKYLALDLGGTNFRVLLVHFKGRNDVQVESKIYAVPKELMLGAGTLLFDHIAQCLATFVEEQQVAAQHLPLGFTFSFPCVQLGLTEALLVRWTKGFQCAGVEQQDVGRLLREAIARRGNLEIDVMAILNDTTGTLMSCAHRNTACRIGVIIGTGCNACYVERVAAVELMEDALKVRDDQQQVLINTEWGAFGDSGTLELLRNTYDRQLDSKTLNKGFQLFEKMIAGMYLGELVRLVLVQAIEAQQIFIRCPQRADYATALCNQPDCFETRYISAIEGDTYPDCTSTRRVLRELLHIEKASIEDCQRLRYICECVSQRAATLVAMGIAVLINRIAEPHVVVGVDGSVYRFHPKFDAYMRATLQKLVQPGISYDLMLSEDGSGRGAALVAAVASRKA